MLKMLIELDTIADSSVDLFMEGIGLIKDFIVENYWIPYAKSE